MQECITIGGGDGNEGKKCIFPFKYNGKKFNHCISKTKNDKPWCSTKVSKGQHHVAQAGNWGYCGPSCPQFSSGGKKSQYLCKYFHASTKYE